MTLAEAKAAWAAMSPEERLAMVKTVPKLIYINWTSYVPWRLFAFGNEVARVDVSTDGSFRWVAGGERGFSNTKGEAQSACYTALTGGGYVLDGGENR